MIVSEFIRARTQLILDNCPITVGERVRCDYGDRVVVRFVTKITTGKITSQSRLVSGLPYEWQGQKPHAFEWSCTPEEWIAFRVGNGPWSPEEWIRFAHAKREAGEICDEDLIAAHEFLGRLTD